MQTDRVQRDAYLIRIWCEHDRGYWRGWVQHVRTGDSVYVQDLDELQEFIERFSSKLDKPSPRGLK